MAATIENNIETKSGEVRLNDQSGHAVFLNQNSGQFIVRYKRDHDWDGPAPADDDSNVIERRYNTMTDVHDFINRRYETQQRVKKTPLNQEVLNATFGKLVVKGIHGGTNLPLFAVADKRLADKVRQAFASGYGADTDLYPVHPVTQEYVNKSVALLAQKDDIERQLRENRTMLRMFAIKTNTSNNRFSNNEEFQKAYDRALATAAAYQQPSPTT